LAQGTCRCPPLVKDIGERRREGLKVPSRRPKKGRLWFNDGSCVRLRPQRPDHLCASRPAPEVVQWPVPPSGAASPAIPAAAPRPVMHLDWNRTTSSGRRSSSAVGKRSVP
jgi:hypothetical protein